MDEKERQKLQDEFPQTSYARHVVGYEIERRICALNASWQDNSEDNRKEMAVEKKTLKRLAGTLKLTINPDTSRDTGNPLSASDAIAGT